jgi:hypothetical protein
MTAADHLSPRTRRRLARSAYAPIGEPVLRTDLLCRLVIERLASLGPLPEGEVLDAIDRRAPGRGPEVITLRHPTRPHPPRARTRRRAHHARSRRHAPSMAA